MSDLQSLPSTLATPGGHDTALAQLQAQPSPDLMHEDEKVEHESTQGPALTAHDEARALVRLVQCPQCSKPYTAPVTLPCGQSVCRTCLPDSHERERITWPDLPDRRRAITCPCTPCGQEHTVADCCIDVTLSKLMDSIADVVVKHNSLSDMAVHQNHDIDSEQTREKGTQSLSTPNGRLISLFNAASAGQLPFDAEVIYTPTTNDPEHERYIDEAVLASLFDASQREMDCQVCYSLMLDPVTTPCGHTLCRNCLARSLDHSLHCPVCRRVVLIRPQSLHGYPSNKTLRNLLDGLCPELVAARKEAMAAEDTMAMAEFDTPLFVVTLGFPSCPTFLRVFEPRYRLMLRRAIEGNRVFGIVMHNATGAPQGELGASHFMQYGTLLRIENAQFMSDGTSIIEAKGVSRFKVLASATIDGYAVGRVERVDDVPLAEEEAMELEETSLPAVDETDVEGQLSRMSTQDMLQIGLDFIWKMQGRSAPWLHEGILQAYGGPPTDASVFPYWFASILPIHDAAKYQLLQTTSVRQRLKVTARWVKLMESQRWYRSNACTVL